jgi:hypothetical protein
MAAIQQSRLWYNLWRDLRNDFRPDESLSILNSSSEDIEVSDGETGATKIVYPRTILHTNRPTTSIIVRYWIGNVTHQIIIPRSAIKKDIISIETPNRFVESTDTYDDILSLKWVNKVLQSADRVVASKHATYYIINDNRIINNGWLILILFMFIIACVVVVVFYECPL